MSGSSDVMFPASTPSAPATTLASTVFAIERALGESPTSMPETSFSDAARVARPNRVQRYIAASATAAATTIPTRMKLSTGTWPPSIATVCVGRNAAGTCGVLPKAIVTQRLGEQQHAERADQLPERSGRPQRPEARELDDNADDRGEHDREHEADGRVDRRPVFARVERPEGVPGQHRHRAGADVDDPRTAVRQNYAERDARDQGAPAEAE